MFTDDIDYEMNAGYDDKRERWGDRCPSCGTCRWGGDCIVCYSEDDPDPLDLPGGGDMLLDIE